MNVLWKGTISEFQKEICVQTNIFSAAMLVFGGVKHVQIVGRSEVSDVCHCDELLFVLEPGY